jgi:hypothetical protein
MRQPVWRFVRAQAANASADEVEIENNPSAMKYRRAEKIFFFQTD